MRITGGDLRGRRVRAPPGSATRPTSDRVREALFSILGPPPPGAWVLDAFAGAGTLGLEALSRGARGACFIDRSSAAVRCLHENVGDLGVAERCRIVRGDTLAVVRRWRPPPVERFHWVFVDPPYARPPRARGGDRTAGPPHSIAGELLALLAGGDLLAEAVTVVVEHDRRHPPEPTYGSLSATDRRRYGDTAVSFYRFARAQAIDSAQDP